MSLKPLQSHQDRHVYIPQHIEKAMAQHMQQSMPAHLKKYQDGNTYIPQHIEKAMAQHMQESVPAHMKEYIGPYMQQKVMDPNVTTPNVSLVPSPNPLSQASVAHSPRQNYFHPPEEQSLNQSAVVNTPEPGVYSSDGMGTPAEPQPLSPVQAYDFITNPAKPPRQSLLNGKPPAVRAAIVSGVLLVLIILGIFIKGLFGGSSNLTSFISIAQDQEELIHIATGAALQKDLSINNKNLAATTKLSLATAQLQIITYLNTNHKKINPKVLNLKVSLETDDQLTAAAAATTYNQTFKEIMKTKLTSYMSDLEQSYGQTKGPKGLALLKSDYAGAQLLLEQLNTPD